ncbi:MAG TPA: 4'-phosphopantetheinyl transferase superfamily protein [Solirubrobacterales bacterium]|nr:4'-phosphopantetheinyl transferase superfamily protein [Solirubrobacterales bacterium]
MSEGWPPGPSRPPAAADLHLWRSDLDAAGWPGPEGLPAAERERAAQMRRPGASARWVAARWALRGVLGRYLEEEPAEIAITPDPDGKPQLQTAPERLRFNLSHSGAIALVALSAAHPVGVDVEELRPDRDLIGLAERALGPEDVAAVRAASPGERELVFHRCWARHEARLKCLGVGIFRDAPPQDVTVAVRDLEVAAGYAAAVAVAAAQMPPMRCWTFGPAALQKDGRRVS